MSRKKSVVYFHKVQIRPLYGKAKFDIYTVVENNRCIVTDAFNSLEEDVKDKIKALITNMATNENYRSPIIKYHLKNYKFGEIRPIPHRFFFFQKCGKNYIFFDYIQKKKRSLNDKIYKAINAKKERYEKEFAEFIKKV